MRESPASPRAVAKRRGAVQQCSPAQKCPSLRRPGTRESRREWPGGFWRAAIVGKEERPPRPFRGAVSAGVVGAALPAMSVAATGPPAHAKQHGEAALLAIVEALVERLRRRRRASSGLRARAVIASAPWRSRAIASGPGRCALSPPRARLAAGRHAPSCGRRAPWRDRGSRFRPRASSSPARR